MPSFMETWLTRKYNLVDEVNTLSELMFSDKAKYWSFYFVANNDFLLWKFRNNTISISDFEEKSGLKKALQEINARLPEQVDIKQIMQYLEYAYNLAKFVYEQASKNQNERENKIKCVAIIKNVDSIIQQCGYQLVEHPSGARIIIIKNAIADMASDIVGKNYNLGEDIYLYRHHSLNGKLIDKADILVRMAKYIEKEIKPDLDGKLNLKQVHSNIGFLSNALDLRHPPSEKEEPVIKKLVEQGKLEQWYDDLYRQMVSLIVLFDCAQKQRDIDELKQQMNPKQ